MSCFNDFSYYLKSCIAVFTFEVAVTSSIYPGYFGREISSASPARDSETFSYLLHTPTPHLFLPLVTEFLNLYAFFLSCNILWSSANSLPFAFPMSVLRLQLVVLLSPVDLIPILFVFTCHLPKLSLTADGRNSCTYWGMRKSFCLYMIWLELEQPVLWPIKHTLYIWFNH